MTGKNPTRLGITSHIGGPQPHAWREETHLLPAQYVDRLPLDEVTLAEVLHDAGYATLHAGKWHLGKEPFWPEYQGFDVNVGGWSQGGPFGGKQYFSPYGNPRLADGPAGEYLPERLADETCRFMEAHRFEPFFVHLSTYSVHVPLVARDDLVEKYTQKRGTDREEFHDEHGVRVRDRQDHAIYAAMVEALDACVGRVLDKLRELKLENDTIVVFTSDNGGLSTGDRVMPADQGWPTTNAPLRAGKGWLYEGGIRVPLIVRQGSKRTAAQSGHVVNGTDLALTLCRLTGVQPSESFSVDGCDFAAALQGSTDARAPVFWHYPHYGNQGGTPGAAMREGRWKLIEWYEDNRLELYDLAADLAENDNVAEQYPEIANRLHEELSEFRRSTGARMPTRNPQTQPKTR
jgi:arylsulfatase A-like enzyme